MNWLDILFLAVIAWNAWAGLRIGLVGGMSRLVGLVAGFWAAFNLSGPIADMADLKWDLTAKIDDALPDLGSKGVSEALKLPSARDIFPPLGNHPDLVERVTYPENALQEGIKSIGEAINRTLAAGILEIFVFLVIFIVAAGLVAFIVSMLGKIISVTPLSPVDKLGGVLFGAGKGLVVITVFLAIAMVLLLPVTFVTGGQDNSWFTLALDRSAAVPVIVKILSAFSISLPGLTSL